MVREVRRCDVSCPIALTDCLVSLGVLDWIDQTGVQVNILDIAQQQQDPLCGWFGHSVLAAVAQQTGFTLIDLALSYD